MLKAINKDFENINTQVHSFKIHEIYTIIGQKFNLLSFLLRCGTRSFEWATQWDLNSLV